MKPIQTRGATHNFNAPEGWDPARDGQCGVLSVRKVRPVVGGPEWHHSTWEPTPEERRLIAKGANIELTCVGVQPPVAMDVADA